MLENLEFALGINDDFVLKSTSKKHAGTSELAFEICDNRGWHAADVWVSEQMPVKMNNGLKVDVPYVNIRLGEVSTKFSSDDLKKLLPIIKDKIQSVVSHFEKHQELLEVYSSKGK